MLDIIQSKWPELLSHETKYTEVELKCIFNVISVIDIKTVKDALEVLIACPLNSMSNLMIHKIYTFIPIYGNIKISKLKPQNRFNIDCLSKRCLRKDISDRLISIEMLQTTDEYKDMRLYGKSSPKNDTYSERETKKKNGYIKSYIPVIHIVKDESYHEKEASIPQAIINYLIHALFPINRGER
jgi:hypothetical protein